MKVALTIESAPGVRMSALQRALLAPGLLILVGLVIAPIALMAVESFRPFVGGRVGAAGGWGPVS